MTHQSRTPAGVPTGGQFAASAKAEAGVSLTAAADPKRHVWSTDPGLVKPPKAAVAFVADAEDAGYDVQVRHDATGVGVSLTRPGSQNSMGLTWTAGHFHDGAPSGKLDFHTDAGRPGVRFDFGEGFVHGAYVSVRSARQARGHLGLPLDAN